MEPEKKITVWRLQAEAHYREQAERGVSLTQKQKEGNI
jgi:hypothetical protein